MLIGLMSDSHDNLPLIKQAVNIFNKSNVELVFHCGDFIAPFCAEELKNLKCKMIGVFGNNDGEKKMWREKVKGWGEIFDGFYETAVLGRKILIIHEPGHLEPLAISQQYDIIVYGHTHKVDCRKLEKTLVINPGECGAWLTGKPTIATVEIPKNNVQFIDLG